MKFFTKNKNVQLIFLTLLILILILSLLVYSLIKEYGRIQYVGIENRPESLLHAPEKHIPLTLKDIDLVESWMTFEYINYIFNIPGNYLREQFSILDIRYPKITVARYADEQGVSRDKMLDQIKIKIRNYLSIAN